MDAEISVDRSEILEPQARVSPVVGDVDVVVIGGGPAGVAAAVAAGRCDSKVMLVERYPYLGGLATGGLVVLFIEYDRYEYGIMKETAERLAKLGGIVFPPKSKRLWAGEEHQRWVEGQGITGAYAPSFDPEILKFVSNEMAMESGVKLFLNSLFVETITEDDIVKGVILENKEGRQAILAKVTIDATGDGDVFARARAPFQTDIHPWGVSLPYLMANVDIEKAQQFRDDDPKEYQKLMDKLKKTIGSPVSWNTTVMKGVVFSFSPYFYGLSELSVDDLTRVEVEGRRKIMTSLDFYRKNVPGFESAVLIETASQIGVRESRRVEGEYTLTKEDVVEGKRFFDVVARNLFDIPYRCLVPRKVDGLLASGRCISTTHEAQASIRMICPCYATGEVAGIAAAKAVTDGVEPREIDVRGLQESLLKHGVVIEDL
jgi:hypothetical protein